MANLNLLNGDTLRYLCMCTAVYLSRHSVVRGREHRPNQCLDLPHMPLHRLEPRQEQFAESWAGERQQETGSDGWTRAGAP